MKIRQFFFLALSRKIPNFTPRYERFELKELFLISHEK